ncbi:MAG TPA: acyl carrier protein [Acidimicrobiales bacterium]|jgi:acyl carrier protein
MVADTIRSIWRKELDLGEFSDDDDFFDLGGHSLVMARIQTRISEELGVEVPMDDLFRHSTVAGISGYLEHAAAK